MNLSSSTPALYDAPEQEVSNPGSEAMQRVERAAPHVVRRNVRRSKDSPVGLMIQTVSWCGAQKEYPMPSVMYELFMELGSAA